MNYETEAALSKKVDDWQFNSLQQEVSGLKQENQALREKTEYVENKLRNHYSALEQLIQIIIDSEQFVEINQLHEIKQYL